MIVTVIYHCKPCRVFGHFSHRSEWQLVKVDYKSIFDRRCAEEDYRPWQLHSQVGVREINMYRGKEAEDILENNYSLWLKNWSSQVHAVHFILLCFMSHSIIYLNIYMLL